MNLLQDYANKLNERADDERAALGRGAATSFDDYRHRTGIIAGINLAMVILTDVYKSKPPEERN